MYSHSIIQMFKKKTKIIKNLLSIPHHHHREFQKYCWALLMLLRNFRNTVEFESCYSRVATPEMQKNWDIIKSVTPEILTKSETFMSDTSKTLSNLCWAVLNCQKRLHLIHGEKCMNGWYIKYSSHRQKNTSQNICRPI